jgi:magnesium transporter
VGLHQKEILSRFARGGCKVIPEAAIPFYRDIYDHFVSVSDLTESYREIVAAALEAYLSMQSQKLNEVMKFLTLLSTVMLPLTFIAGIYGMNFKFMPELDWEIGYPIALGLMATVAVFLFWYFKRRKFL